MTSAARCLLQTVKVWTSKSPVSDVHTQKQKKKRRLCKSPLCPEVLLSIVLSSIKQFTCEQNTKSRKNAFGFPDIQLGVDDPSDADSVLFFQGWLRTDSVLHLTMPAQWALRPPHQELTLHPTCTTTARPSTDAFPWKWVADGLMLQSEELRWILLTVVWNGLA